MNVDIINNREDIFIQLRGLNKDATPVFGKMSPQHVVEHLSVAISISNGSGPQKQYTTPEDAEAIKNKLIYSDNTLQPGIKSPILGDDPPPFKFPDLPTAIEQLKKELEDFDQFYEVNPEAKMIHPRMGPLDKKEWTILHNKHIAHHFRQFGLI